MDELGILRIAEQIIDKLHLRTTYGAHMKPKDLAKAIRDALPKNGGKVIPNKFEKPTHIGYAVKYNGVVVPQSFALGFGYDAKRTARRLFTSWAADRGMKGISFESEQAEDKAILVRLKEMKE